MHQGSTPFFPWYSRCAPLVHPMYTPCTRCFGASGKAWDGGDPGTGVKRCVWPFLGGAEQVKARSWPQPNFSLQPSAFNLSLPVRGPIQAGWLNHIEIYFSIIQSKVLPPNDFKSLARSADRLEPFARHYEIMAKCHRKILHDPLAASAGIARRADMPVVGSFNAGTPPTYPIHTPGQRHRHHTRELPLTLSPFRPCDHTPNATHR